MMTICDLQLPTRLDEELWAGTQPQAGEFQWYNS